MKWQVWAIGTCLVPALALGQAQGGNMKYRNSQQIDRSTTYPSQSPNAASLGSLGEVQLSRDKQTDDMARYNNYQPGLLTADTLLTFRASVLCNVVAVDHVALFSLTQVGPTADSTNQLMEQTIQCFIARLAPLNIKRSQVFIDMISLEPQYEYQSDKKIFNKRYREVPKGFLLKKNVHVRYADDQQFNDIMLAATACEVYDLIKVDYFVAGIDSIYSRMRAQAQRILFEKRSTYQALLGMGFDSTYTRTAAEEIYSYYPGDRYFNYTTAGTVSLEAARKRAGEPIPAPAPTVTQYYHPLPQSAFDAVLNPSVFEPAVQFVCRWVLRYPQPYRHVPLKPAAPPSSAPIYYQLDDEHKLVVPLRPQP